MKTTGIRAALCLFACAWSTFAESAVRFEDLSGWWAADPTHGGESSRLVLEFVEKDGKPEARLSIIAMGAYGIGLGEVTMAGDSIDTRGLSFPLTWNPTTRTLTGILPPDLVPLYRVPVEFKRSTAVEKPPAREWNAPKPEVVWSLETGAAVWAGLEHDAKSSLLFVGNDAGVLRAIDYRGKVRWQFDTGKPIRAQPRVLAKSVYVSSDSGFLHKLNARSGTEEWRARIDSGAPPRVPTNEKGTRWDRYGSSVVADAKQVYVASRDKQVYALDLATGKELWRVAAGDMLTATPALHGDLLIFGAYDGKISAVATRDGTPRWSYDATLAITGDIVIAGNRVLAGSRSYDLVALDAATGQELWKSYYWFSWIESPPAVQGDIVFTGSSDAKHIYARNLRDGSLRWKTPVPGWAWSRTAVYKEWLVAGTVGQGAYPGSPDGALLALDANTGEIRWMYREKPPEAKSGNWGFAAAPVIALGVVYAADLDGKVYAFK
jgi:outer membrane protein assembly factor BamB